MNAYYDAWRFWGDGDHVFGLTISELEEALQQADRIAERERRAMRNWED